MYVGNGESISFPIPKDRNGDIVVFSVGGRCAILKHGEGYEIRDDSIVFETPPPNGAIISFAEKPGTYTATDAVHRITEGIEQMTALIDGLRSFVSAKQAEMTEAIAQLHRDAEAARDEAVRKLEKKFESVATETADDILDAIRDDIEDVRRCYVQTQTDRDLCEKAVVSVETKIKDFNKETDNLLESCFQAEGSYRDECERLVNIITDGESKVEKKYEEVKTKFDTYVTDESARLNDTLRTMRATVSELVTQVGAVRRKVEAAQTEQVIIKKRS